jgi:hypothetical protein
VKNLDLHLFALQLHEDMRKCLVGYSLHVTGIALIKKKEVEPLNKLNLSLFIKSLQCLEQRLVMESTAMGLYYSASMCTTSGYVVISS